MNTIIRLVVLIPATIFAFLMAWVGVGFSGLTPLSILVALMFVGVPSALLVWTIKDHSARKMAETAEGEPL